MLKNEIAWDCVMTIDLDWLITHVAMRSRFAYTLIYGCDKYFCHFFCFVTRGVILKFQILIVHCRNLGPSWIKVVGRWHQMPIRSTAVWMFKRQRQSQICSCNTRHRWLETIQHKWQTCQLFREGNNSVARNLCPCALVYLGHFWLLWTCLGYKFLGKMYPRYMLVCKFWSNLLSIFRYLV